MPFWWWLRIDCTQSQEQEQHLRSTITGENWRAFLCVVFVGSPPAQNERPTYNQKISFHGTCTHSHWTLNYTSLLIFAISLPPTLDKDDEIANFYKQRLNIIMTRIGLFICLSSALEEGLEGEGPPILRSRSSSSATTLIHNRWAFWFDCCTLPRLLFKCN